MQMIAKRLSCRRVQRGESSEIEMDEGEQHAMIVEGPVDGTLVC